MDNSSFGRKKKISKSPKMKPPKPHSRAIFSRKMYGRAEGGGYHVRRRNLWLVTSCDKRIICHVMICIRWWFCLRKKKAPRMKYLTDNIRERRV
jgi:hypothetical protein